DVEIGYKHRQEDLAPIGRGRFTVTDLACADSEWLPQLQGELILNRQQLLVRDVTGTSGQGVVRARLGLSWKGPLRGWFDLKLDRVEAARLLAPVPGLRGVVQGPVEARFRGRLDREWYGHGDLVLTHGKVGGVEVTEWRLPVNATWAPAEGRGRIEVRDSQAHLALGRATAEATLAWGSTARLEGKAQFLGVDLRSLLQHATDIGPLGGGRTTGKITFEAT